MGEVIEYGDVVQEIRGAIHPGRLKLQSNSIIFKNIKTGKIDTLQSSEIEKFQWLIRARGYCLKVLLSNGTIHRFDGLKDTEFERLSSFVTKHYESSLEKVDIATKGWNWGKAVFEGNSLNFNVDNKQAFEVPLGNVSHSMTGKNEVILEFHQNDDAAVSLMELRFHIPGDSTQETDPVQNFYDNVLSKADIIQATGEAIAIFQEVHCLTPRGRYDVKLYPSFLQLHGKTFDYKIPYTSILRLFLLPHRDGRQMFFVVSLDPPIKQGQTRYPFIIMLFNKEDETTLELGMSEDDITEKYEGKLQKEMSGLEYEIVSRLMKSIVNRKITVPGSFMGHTGTQSISCSYKASTGFLYPLDRGFIFVHKPPMHIRFDEIASVNFARSSGTTRSFDFEIETKAQNVHTFVSIDKDEYGKLYDFVTQKKLRVKNVGSGKLKLQDGVSYKDDLDESDEDNHDAYMERMKAEGKDRNEDDLDDDSDSSDESFNPDIQEASDVAEEWDSNPTTTDSSDSDEESGSASQGEDEETRRLRKEKKKAEKEAKKAEKEKKKAKKAKTVKEPGTRKKKKTKKSKDPNAPKRPQSAFFIWLNEHRDQIKEENPGIAVTEVGKIAGEKWRAIEDKSKWEKKAEQAKADYEKAMEEYREKVKDQPQESSDEEGDGSPKAKRKKKSSPKKPVTDSRAGAGENFKSKEFISDSESSKESDDDEDKPLKPKKEKKAEKKKEVKKEESASGGGSESEKEETPKKETPKKEKKEKPKKKETPKKDKKKSKKDEGPSKKTRGQRRASDSESEVGSLPSDEEILEGSPNVSGDEGPASESESESGSD